MANVSVPNNGLLMGLAEGIKQGFLTYQTQKNLQHEQKMQELMQGVERDADGNLVPTAARQQQVDLQSTEGKRKLAKLDPNSPESQAARNIYKGVLENSKRGSGGLVSDKMSAADLEDNAKLFGSDVSGQYGLLKNITSPLAQVKEKQLQETMNEHANKAGKSFVDNKIINAANQNIGSLKRSLSILDNPNKPVTNKDLNLAYTDYINAVAAGGAATEGKIQRELPETWVQEFNNLRQKLGDNADLRESAAGRELVNMLRENIRTVHKDLREAKIEQGKNLATAYSESSNPKVRAVVEAQLKKLQEGEDIPLSPDEEAARKLKRLQELRAKAGGGQP